MSPTARRPKVHCNQNPPLWRNRHQNVTVAGHRRFYDVTPAPRDPTQILGDMRLTTEVLQGILSEAVPVGARIRCIGGAWSLSNVVETDGFLVNTRPLNLCLRMNAAYVHPSYDRTKINRLYFAQCGMSVQEVNNVLWNNGMALPTSGASNGQTIAGAISTGTHGSAFDVGSMTEFVVGIHLVIAPDRNVWLERESASVVSDHFLDLLGAERLPSTDIFDATLVSFGSFGIIHGLLLEAEPVYLLEANRKRYPLDANLRTTMRTLDFGTLLPDTQDLRHFEVNFNPHDILPDDPAKGAYVTTMYKRRWEIWYQRRPLPSGQLAIGNSFLSFIGNVAQAIPPALVSTVVNELFASNYKEFARTVRSPGEMFDTTDLHGIAMSMELGVALADAELVLNLLLAERPQRDAYAGVWSFRYVKRSSALLGFTKFDPTCTIEFNAVHNGRTLDFYRQVWNDLSAAGIPYTLHWGQMGPYTAAQVRAMYGQPVIDAWRAARSSLLSATMQQVFSSPFTDQCGLT